MITNRDEINGLMDNDLEEITEEIREAWVTGDAAKFKHSVRVLRNIIDSAEAIFKEDVWKLFEGQKNVKTKNSL